jgi:hypothetical protein
MQTFPFKLLNYFVQDPLGPQDQEHKGTLENSHPNTKAYISAEMSLK